MSRYLPCLLLSLAACAGDEPAPDLAERAYVVGRDSDELVAIDLRDLTVAGRVATGAIAAHMAEVSRDGTTVYVTSPDADEVVVVDAASLTVTGRIPVGRAPTHLTMSHDGRWLAVVAEGEDAISLVDPTTDVEVARIGGMSTPHFVRFTADGRAAYVANIGAHHVTRIDLDARAVAEHLVLDGFEGPPSATIAPGETGFADVQIAPDGLLYAAHARTGRVLVHDTIANARVAELDVGAAPWVAFAEHPFEGLPARSLVTNHGDQTVSVIDGDALAVTATAPGDPQAYGVNLSPLAPDRAYVMNRARHDVGVIDVDSGALLGRIDVGGTTETAATSADGRWIVAAVSSADRVVVIDAASGEIAATLDDVGAYPWSVTIANGQSYCH